MGVPWKVPYVELNAVWSNCKLQIVVLMRKPCYNGQLQSGNPKMEPNAQLSLVYNDDQYKEKLQWIFMTILQVDHN